MKKIIPVIQLVLSLAVIGALKVWAPVCDGVIDLANGNQTHMKCWFASQAGIGLAIVLIAVYGVALIAGSDKRKLIQIVGAVAAIALILEFSSFIGVCMMPMACHLTRKWMFGLAGAIIVLAVADVVTGGKDKQLPE